MNESSLNTYIATSACSCINTYTLIYCVHSKTYTSTYKFIIFMIIILFLFL